ncbi:MAG: ABC transporter permease, partial [Candidatus Adiutrix sp.]
MKSWVVAKAEIKIFWRSTAGGLALAVFLGFFGFFFYNGIYSYVLESLAQAARGRTLDASIALFSQALVQVGFVLMLVAPLVTMRSLASLKRGGHLDFYQNLGLSPLAMILGVYGAAFFNLGLMLLLSVPPFLVLLWAEVASPHLLISGYLGLFLLAGSFAALGVLASAIASSPMGAALVALGILGFMWMLGWAAPYMGGNFGVFWQGLTFSPRLSRFALGFV